MRQERIHSKRGVKSAGRSVAVASFGIDSAIVVGRDDFVGEDQRNIVRNHSIALSRRVVAETCLVY